MKSVLEERNCEVKMPLCIVVVLAILSSQVTLSVADEHNYFTCFTDVCNFGTSDQFCSVLERRCRDCLDVRDDCFTSRLPSNCSTTCIRYNTDLAIQKAKETGCGKVMDIMNGSHNTSITNAPVPGDVIRITCDPGYRLSGSGTVECKEFGQWAHEWPTCEEIRCPRLPVVDNGSHNGSLSSSHPPGTVVVTVCRSGFQSMGPNSTKCNPDGSWSRQLSLCLNIECSNPPLIRNGFWYPVHTAETPYAIGDEIHAACDDGFKLDNTNTLTCSDEAEWISPAAQLFFPGCFIKGENSGLNGWMISTIILGLMLAMLVCCVIKVCKYYSHLPGKFRYILVNKDVEKNSMCDYDTRSSSRDTVSVIYEKNNRNNEGLQREANNQCETRPDIPNPTDIRDAIPKKAETLQQFANTGRRVAGDGHAETGRRVADDGHAETGHRVADDGHAETGHRVADDGHAETGHRVADDGHAGTRRRVADDVHVETGRISITINNNNSNTNENTNTNTLSGITNTQPPAERPADEPNSSSATTHAMPSRTPAVMGEASYTAPVEESARFHPAQPESASNSEDEDESGDTHVKGDTACNNDIPGTGLVVQQNINNEQDLGRKIAMSNGNINTDDLNGHV